MFFIFPRIVTAVCPLFFFGVCLFVFCSIMPHIFFLIQSFLLFFQQTLSKWQWWYIVVFIQVANINRSCFTNWIHGLNYSELSKIWIWLYNVNLQIMFVCNSLYDETISPLTLPWHWTKILTPRVFRVAFNKSLIVEQFQENYLNFPTGKHANHPNQLSEETEQKVNVMIMNSERDSLALNHDSREKAEGIY